MKPGSNPTKWLKSARDHPRITFLFILSLALGLRLIRIQTRGIWYDDAFSILLSEQSLATIIKGTAADTMPPLSYFLLHYWMMLGHSIWFIRLLNIILNLVVIGIAYLWIKQQTDTNAALLTAGMMAISPFQILHAQEIRMYILLDLGIIGSFWCFQRIEVADKPSWLDWLGYCFFCIVAVYSHNLAIFSLVVADAYLLLRKHWKLLTKLIVAQLFSMAAFLPWIFLVPGQIQKIQTAFWTPRPGLIEIIQAADTLLGSLPQPSWIVIVLSILCLQVFALIIWQIWKNRKDPNVQFMSLLVFLPGILLFIASYVMRPVYVPRAMIASGVGIYGLIGILASARFRIGVDQKAKTNPAPALLATLVILASLISLPYQYIYARFPRSPFAELDRYLAANCALKADCLVLHDNKLSYFPAFVYNRNLNQRFMADAPGTFNDTLALASQEAMNQLAFTKLSPAVDGYGQVFFITFQKALDEYSAGGKTEHPSITELINQYKLVRITPIGDLLVYEFSQ
jgi:mannosyltransferase